MSSMSNTTYYKVFDTEDEAKEFSHQEALSRGCDGIYTRYWWGWIVHPETGQAAIKRQDKPVLSTEIIQTENGEEIIHENLDPEWLDSLDESWFPKHEEI